jgi:ABC-2 type transport system ATP-binding protein
LPAIKCENLTKHFGKVVALEGLNLEVEEHSIFGFLGPNGAGKTTTVKMLMGLSQPTAGKAWINGGEIGSAGLRSRIGFLPDVPAFYNWMSGREYMRFTAELHHLPSGEGNRRCEELLELVELKKAAARKIGGYSRGMKQRLGLAQALVNRPSVLFLDEPCSALDPMGRRDVLELIQRLKENTTVFMSTHILSDVERVCDSVGIINKGKLVTVSSVEDLRARYTTSRFELEFEEDPALLVATLQVQPWVTKAEKMIINQSPLVQVQAKNVVVAKKEIPQMIVASGLTLLRYELTHPSLEEIFVELVGGAE